MFGNSYISNAQYWRILEPIEDGHAVEGRKLEHGRPPAPSQIKKKTRTLNHPTCMFQRFESTVELLLLTNVYNGAPWVVIMHAVVIQVILVIILVRSLVKLIWEFPKIRGRNLDPK